MRNISYNYVLANPVIYIDPSGKSIVVPSVENRTAILKMINSRAAGTFKFDNNGSLYQYESGSPETGSTYYAEQLVKGIDSERKVEIMVVRKFKNPLTGKDGKTIKEPDTGKDFDVDADFGGGVTGGNKGTDQIVFISGNENKSFKDTNGKPLKDKAADILAHELVGHAIPRIVGSDTGNAVENENKIRRQLKEGENQLREKDPAHKE